MKTISIRNQPINYFNNDGHFKQVESNKWEPETFDVLDQYIKPGKTFLDIGAWIGTLSIYAAKLGANVISIEPDVQARKWLLDNLEANDCVNTVLNCAVSNKRGTAKLSNPNQFGDSMSSLVHGNDNYVEVETIPLSDLLGDNICLIKIDIEGGEYDVFNSKTLIDLVQVNCPPILLSVHPAWIKNYGHFIENLEEYKSYYEMETIAHDLILLK